MTGISLAPIGMLLLVACLIAMISRRLGLPYSVGLAGAGSTFAEIEALNYGHIWPYEHAGGELHVVLFDNDYRDNKGPGTHFCVVPAP